MASFRSRGTGHGTAAAPRSEGGSRMGGRRQELIEPTEEWEQLALLCRWPEQLVYEEIRPLTLFGASVAERARETGAAERTLYRRVGRFEEEGMESLFGSEHARRRRLPPAMRRLIVDLKAEYPGFNPNEIANALYVRFGRRPDRKTVQRVLDEEPIPLRFVRRFAPYAEIPEARERRTAVVALHAEGWSAKAIACYLGAHKSTVHRVLKRWAEEGPEGLEDQRPGRPPGVRKVTLKAMEAVRRLQRNPGLGEFRVHAALAQVGIHLSPRTFGRILALNRELYGLEKPKGPVKQKREMPFAARRRHQFWTADVRYLKGHKVGGRAYVISVLDNHSRAILASAVTRTQDLASYLSVLYVAVLVCTQMTKTGVLAARFGGDHVPDLHLLAGDDHPIDQKLHQLTPLLEGGAFQSTRTRAQKSSPGAEILYGTRHASQLHALVGLRLQLLLLAL
jgi:putative transposase